jgi:two-component system response regulator MprA
LSHAARVLLVEDEPALARLVENVLDEEGYRVTVAGDGASALTEAELQNPDLVLLDLSLPRVDGLEVCRRLRIQGRRMPVIVLTARDSVPDRVSGLDAGADDYLIKPFAFDELLARMRAQLRRQREPDHLRVADLELDPRSRSVRRAGQEVELSDQEFRLLEMLMRHPGQVLTRGKLLDHVWGYDAEPSSNVVDIYVHYLRRKIDRGRQQSLIRTVRSVGYVLQP